MRRSVILMVLSMLLMVSLTGCRNMFSSVNDKDEDKMDSVLDDRIDQAAQTEFEASSSHMSNDEASARLSQVVDENRLELDNISETFHISFGERGLDGPAGDKGADYYDKEDMVKALNRVKPVDVDKLSVEELEEIINGLSDDERTQFEIEKDRIKQEREQAKINRNKVRDMYNYCQERLRSMDILAEAANLQNDVMQIVDYDTFKSIWHHYCSRELYNLNINDMQDDIINDRFTKADIDSISVNTPFSDPDKNYAVVIKQASQGVIYYDVQSCYVEDNKLNMDIVYSGGSTGDTGCGAIVVVPVDKNIELGCIDIEWKYKDDPYGGPDGKPVIYLYGYDEDVDVKLADEHIDFTYLYPAYNGKWSVKAKPDGTLTDESGRAYKYLFWEGYDDIDWDMSEGFCVKTEDLADFLEEKLEIFGLEDTEANDFITYWAPQMQGSKYNVISFQVEEYEKELPIKVNPEPDTSIRFLMTWYGSDKHVDIKEQELKPMRRSGKTVIEWGGQRCNYD